VFHVHRFIPLRSVRERTVYVLRDGRDAIVSFYFHIVREWEQPIKRRMERRLGREMTAENIRENLPQFIDFMQGNRTHSIDYRAHVEEWRRRQEVYVALRYEDLLKDTVAQLSRVVFEVTGTEPSAELVRAAVAKHDFTRLTGRQRGVHDPSSFLRKGVEGDWRNHFSPEAARLYDAYAGDLLIELGYETSRSWVSAIT